MIQATKILSLCAPDQEKSCFACCPPIRPAHYEHIQYRKTVERFLRENRQAYDPLSKKIRPITGFSCWALGFIDDEYKRVGCLLHPAQNKGNDLRFRIDYGDKCRRETCEEEKVFASLKSNERRFWIHLADGLDSFAYSSKSMNPLFKVLGWGRYLLQCIATEEAPKTYSWQTFIKVYPFFSTDCTPKGNAYLVNELVRRHGLHILKTRSFGSELEAVSKAILGKIQDQAHGRANDPFVHQLDLDTYFLDFLRLSGNITKLDQDSAVSLKRTADDELGLISNA